MRRATPVWYSKQEMKQAAAAKTTHSVSGDPTLGVRAVAVAFLDTTWRIAFPVLLFTGLGIYIDLHAGTKPWVTFICVIIGFALALVLIKRQLARARSMEDKS